jgi:hypothetical protein
LHFPGGTQIKAGGTMRERQTPRAREAEHEHEKTIAAFDRERDEVHELSRRHHEIITNSRRNDRPIRQDYDDEKG